MGGGAATPGSSYQGDPALLTRKTVHALANVFCVLLIFKRLFIRCDAYILCKIFILHAGWEVGQQHRAADIKKTLRR